MGYTFTPAHYQSDTITERGEKRALPCNLPQGEILSYLKES